MSFITGSLTNIGIVITCLCLYAGWIIGEELYELNQAYDTIKAVPEEYSD